MFYRVLKYIMLHFAPLITSFGTVRFRIYIYTIVVYIRMHISLIKRWGYRPLEKVVGITCIYNQTTENVVARAKVAEGNRTFRSEL